jgi:hypothetical protein
MTSNQEIVREVESSNIRPIPTLQIFVSVLLLLAVSLCFDMLLGISEGLGLPIKLFLIVTVMACIVLRLGWLALIAIQVSLLMQEPSRWQVELSPGPLWVIVAMLTIVAAMKLPQTHRTDLLARLSRTGENQTDSPAVSPQATFPMAIPFFQILLAIVLSSLLIPLMPIGPKTNQWLASSLKRGQAFWPGSFWLVVMIAVFVILREAGWRMIDRPQSRLYLRSVKLIAHYRDLARFERARTKFLRSEKMSLTPPAPAIAKPIKMSERTKIRKPESKGSN